MRTNRSRTPRPAGTSPSRTPSSLAEAPPGADGPFGDPRRAHGTTLRGLLLALRGRRLERLRDRRRLPRLGDDHARLPARRRAHRDHRDRAHRPATASASTPRPTCAPTADELAGRPRPRPARALRARPRGWPRRPFGPLGPAQMIPWLGQYWAPHLLAATVTGRFGDRDARRRAGLRREELGRRVRRPLVVGPGRGRGLRGRADPRRRADRGRRLDARRPGHARAAAGPHRRPRRRRRMAHPRAARRAGGWRSRARRRTRCCCPSRCRRERRLEVRSRHHLLGRIARHACTAAAGCGCDHEGPAGARRRRYARMTSSAMSSSPPASRPSARSTWSQTASGGSRTSISALPQQLEAVVDRARRGPRSARRCRARPWRPPGPRRVCRSYSVTAGPERRPRARGDERRLPSSGRPAAAGGRPARTSAGASRGS